MWPIFFLAFPLLIQAQNGEEAVVENAENFRKLYGIATRIMELSGNIMGGGGNGGGGYEEVRPRFQGLFANANFIQQTTTTTTERPTGFKAIIDSFLGSGSGGGVGDDSENLPPPPTPRPRPRQNLFSLLGGAPASESASKPQASNIFGNLFGGMLPQTTTTTTEATPVQKIMNIFVPQPERRESEQSSRGKINILELFGMAPRTTTTTTQAPLQALFNPSKPYSGGPEDLDGIMNALMRSNARPARQEPASLLSQFFGGRK
ncbi:unnamed protein product [Caenorhabditis bovis]|uniref:Uncharacterized protein n=1 Tax=Caenorhabditis bovis TaxID=2654633 RepID=A0A8S1ECZ1_9PELO|nr:unnamed protein product [Caenorhabditis bovis]